MKYRDLNLYPWDDRSYLVVSCDSSGGIGGKTGDLIRTSPRILGFYTAQVALMEMLSIGVTPLILSNTLSVEMNPSGEEILAGIRDALDLLELSDRIEVTGSTEENITVSSTGLGITLMGKLLMKDWVRPRTQNHDLAVVAGIPRVGQEVLNHGISDQFSLKVLKGLLGNDYIHELIPGGSRGIIHEIRELESRENLTFRELHEPMIDLSASCGPATSALITLSRADLERLRKNLTIPVYVVGEFMAEDGKE